LRIGHHVDANNPPLKLCRNQLGAKICCEFLDHGASRKLIKHHLALADGPEIRAVSPQAVLEQHRLIIQDLLLNFSKRQRLSGSETRVTWASRPDLVFNIVKLGLQFVEVRFHLRRFPLLLVSSQTRAGYFFSNFLLAIKVVLLAL
jgi:hypothetical protein